ncbi:muscular LMNA-interacting protein isoform X2 [Denticeps clupeoides]|uniref:Muscular LMNA-interacting protein n=1 Tax=Denticeps clupeoides TaxID=299321 RepID=A0AAY4DQ44_9TELE|nr:muscular LMNA-interacting protein isoform X2 [Denticeps clupeoides]XP_028843851.1 muscular LMNA-interacting protein isoform X2 [Denticeps clupeoides]
MEHFNGNLGKVTAVASTKLNSFTFVPMLKKLPSTNHIDKVTGSGQSSNKPNQNSQAPDETMTDEGIYKAEFVYIGDSEEEFGESHIHPPNTKLKLTSDPTVQAPLPVPVTAPRKNKLFPPGISSPASSETGASSGPGCQESSFGPDLCQSRCLEPETDEGLSPANSVDLLASLASSRESILSECWDRNKGWPGSLLLSPGPSPVPFSRAVSPCSSVRSGAFSPALVRVRRHCLAPGSTLARMSSSCSTSCCNSPAPSPCPASPRATKHRLPPTQLSLLTAILRKGRLPVLSSSVQRPYSPCWPISPVSVAGCAGCSAASQVPPVSIGVPGGHPSDAKKPPRSCHRETPLLECTKKLLESSSIPPPEPSKCSWSSRTSPEHSLKSTAMKLRASLKFPTDHRAPPPRPVGAELHVSPAPKPRIYTSFSQLRSLSPKPSYASCCGAEGPTAFQQQPGLAHKTDRRSPPHGPSYRTSPLPKSGPSAPCPSLSRDLTPSPSFSLSATPSPTPKSGGADKKSQPHKIRSAYKVLAAIPTNTLLLEQQAIDEEVENEKNPLDPADDLEMEGDTHAKMCTPAQLRAQSEELYAVIDEVLEDSAPLCRSIRSPMPPMGSPEPKTTKQYAPKSSPGSAGRETKYAANHLQPPSSNQSTLTKPGVIRPLTPTLTLADEMDEEKYHSNPFNRFLDELTQNSWGKCSTTSLDRPGNGGEGSPGCQTGCHERTPPRDARLPALHITSQPGIHSQAEEMDFHRAPPPSLNPTEEKMELQETHV